MGRAEEIGDGKDELMVCLSSSVSGSGHRTALGAQMVFGKPTLVTTLPKLRHDGITIKSSSRDKAKSNHRWLRPIWL